MFLPCDIATHRCHHVVRDVEIGLPELGNLLLKIEQGGQVRFRQNAQGARNEKLLAFGLPAASEIID